jgi:hypothetical protein
MASSLVTRSVGAAARRVPGLRRIPAARLLLLAEVAALARDHVAHLTPPERRRLVWLLRKGRGRPSNLSSGQREELAELVAKMEPRLLAGEAVKRLSPVPLPKRLLFGKRAP